MKKLLNYLWTNVPSLGDTRRLQSNSQQRTMNPSSPATFDAAYPIFTVPDDVRDPNPLNAYINVIEHIDDEVGRSTHGAR